MCARRGRRSASWRTISRAAALHDVGKVGIPDSILLKPGKLTEAEYEIMKNHTLIGAELLDGDDAETERAINAELETQLEIDGWQYYYVFEYPQHASERRRRHELATRLDAMFPLIAFIGLNSI